MAMTKNVKIASKGEGKQKLRIELDLRNFEEYAKLSSSGKSYVIASANKQEVTWQDNEGNIIEGRLSINLYIGKRYYEEYQANKRNAKEGKELAKEMEQTRGQQLFTHDQVEQIVANAVAQALASLK